MNLPVFVVDAFASRTFEGNPAAVVLLDDWLPRDLMQNIAAEHNLSETSFVRSAGRRHEIRWFSPTAEVPFCGHATLAAAHVLHTERGIDTPISFRAAIGTLAVDEHDERYALRMPVIAQSPYVGRLPTNLPPVEEAFVSFENVFVRLRNEADVRDYVPNVEEILALHPFGLAITAPGRDVDFVSRYFAPGFGIPEDPVTGSIHATLVPYWSRRLSKRTLTAKQLSVRGATLECEVQDRAVIVRGSATTYLRGTIELATVPSLLPPPPYLRMR